MAQEQQDSKPTRIIGTGHLHLPIMGLKVTVRRPSMYSLVAAGGLPGELTSLVWKIFGGKESSLADILEQGQEVKNFAMLVEKFIPAVLVDPVVYEPKIGEARPEQRVVDGELHGTISALDIPDIDKNHLFLFGIGVIKCLEEQEAIREGVVADDLSTFRDEQPRADSGSAGAALQPAAEPASGAGSAEPTGA
jgi:hypothetical protein